jgi:NDP-sugar pyrophosphorylase family protein
VLAGGLGTRLRSVLGDTPKLIAPIAGRAYLDWLLDWLQEFGARRVVLGLGHGAQAVIDHLRAHSRPAMSLACVVEPAPLGTAGAMRFARAELRSDPVLVLNGDSLADVDLCRMLAQHRQGRAVGTLLCVEAADAGRYGRVMVDAAGRIEGFIEKDPAFRGDALVSAGIYLLSAALLDQVAEGQASSLEREVFERLPKGSLAAFSGRFAFIDIGTPDSLASAGAFFGGRAGTLQTEGRSR